MDGERVLVGLWALPRVGGIEEASFGSCVTGLGSGIDGPASVSEGPSSGAVVVSLPAPS